MHITVRVNMRLSSDELGGILRKPVPPVKPPSPRERAAISKLAVLSTLAAYGHLRPVEVDAACWNGSRWGLQMAQRCLRHLVETGEVKLCANSVGSTSFVLTHLGARTLDLHGLKGRHGLDIRSVSGGTFMHHSITSRYVIEKNLQGYEAFTEFGVAAGFAPISTSILRDRFRKMCDGILIEASPELSTYSPHTGNKRLFLLEVESARKPKDELMRILSLTSLVGSRVHPELPYVLAGIFIVYAEPTHAGRIQRAAASLWSQCGAARKAELAGSVTMVEVNLGLPLVWRDFSERPLTI
jgi:hypothetical protein